MCALPSYSPPSPDSVPALATLDVALAGNDVSWINELEHGAPSMRADNWIEFTSGLRLYAPGSGMAPRATAELWTTLTDWKPFVSTSTAARILAVDQETLRRLADRAPDGLLGGPVDVGHGRDGRRSYKWNRQQLREWFEAAGKARSRARPSDRPVPAGSESGPGSRPKARRNSSKGKSDDSPLARVKAGEGW